MAAERKLKIVVQAKNDTRKGFDAVKRGMQKLRAAVSRGAALAMKAVKAAAAAAAGVVVAILVAMAREVKRQFAEIDQLAKTAMRLGIGVEQMRGLQLAAKLGGVELSQLNTILRDTARRTSEAAKGTGEAVDALDELGLDPRALNRLSAERQFDTILAALRDVENGNDRVRLAYDTMGRSGVQALSMMKGSLHAARLEAELLTGTITPELAGDIQDANDEVARMRAAWSGVAQEIAGNVAPHVEALAKLVKESLTVVRLGLANDQNIFWEQLKARWFNFLALVTDGIVVAMKGVADVANDLLGSVGIDFDPSGNATAFVEGMGEVFREDAARIERAMDKLANLSGNLPTFEVDTGDIGGAGGRGGRRQLPRVSEGRLLTGGADAGGDRLRRLTAEADRRRSAEAKRREEQADETNRLLREALRSGAGGMGGLLQGG